MDVDPTVRRGALTVITNLRVDLRLKLQPGGGEEKEEGAELQGDGRAAGLGDVVTGLPAAALARQDVGEPEAGQGRPPAAAADLRGLLLHPLLLLSILDTGLRTPATWVDTLQILYTVQTLQILSGQCRQQILCRQWRQQILCRQCIQCRQQILCRQCIQCRQQIMCRQFRLQIVSSPHPRQQPRCQYPRQRRGWSSSHCADRRAQAPGQILQICQICRYRYLAPLLGDIS